MNTSVHGDSLHRLMKQALDSGAAKSVEEAQRMFDGYRLSVAIDPEDAENPAHQAALLTVVALASRVFLGGVDVCGTTGKKLMIPASNSSSLAEEIIRQGGNISPQLGDEPVIYIGGQPRPKRNGFAVRTQAAGWRGGIVPAHSGAEIDDKDPVSPAATLSAALAVNEAYFSVSNVLPSAGHRTLGMSLWDPRPEKDWRTVDSSEPILKYLPSRLWLIGLGHLGQAYLWNLGLLPYSDSSDLHLVLQDIDEVTVSTYSTSILTAGSMVGKKKTRVMADWAERQGFSVSLHERYFAADFFRQSTEPTVALCGLDNALGRRALDKAGFDLIVEAGLGRGHRDFQKIRMHTLPGHRNAEDIWPEVLPAAETDLPKVYANLVSAGTLDRCGATLLAGKAVGAPFVGMVASCLVVSEVLRVLQGGRRCQLADIDLLSIDHRNVVCGDPDSKSAQINPGFTAARIN